MSRSSFALVVLATIALAGCSSGSKPTDPTVGPTVPPSSVPPSSVPATPPGQALACDPAKAQWALGKAGDAALLEKARVDAGAKIARILKPGQAVTMEYNESRLNLRVDANGAVDNVNCG